MVKSAESSVGNWATSCDPFSRFSPIKRCNPITTSKSARNLRTQPYRLSQSPTFYKYMFRQMFVGIFGEKGILIYCNNGGRYIIIDVG